MERRQAQVSTEGLGFAICWQRQKRPQTRDTKQESGQTGGVLEGGADGHSSADVNKREDKAWSHCPMCGGVTASDTRCCLRAESALRFNVPSKPSLGLEGKSLRDRRLGRPSPLKLP